MIITVSCCLKKTCEKLYNAYINTFNYKNDTKHIIIFIFIFWYEILQSVQYI